MAIAGYKHAIQGGAGLKNGNDWANAYGEAELETFLEGAPVGYVVFIMDGTYTLDSDIVCVNATAVNPTALIGVKSGTVNEGANVLYSDWARDAADRPLFNCGAAWDFTGGQYYDIRNIDFTGSVGGTLVQMGSYSITENCKATQSTAVANRIALQGQTEAALINCEATNPAGNGINCGLSGRAFFCYAHDCGNIGFQMGNNGVFYAFNIADNCVDGFNVGSRDYCVFLNNTVYDCDIGFSGTDGDSTISINNLLENCSADGFKWTTQLDSNFFWNNWGDDVRNNDMWDLVDETTVFQDYPNNTVPLTGDPLFVNPGVDHSLQDDSGCLGTGDGITLGVG